MYSVKIILALMLVALANSNTLSGLVGETEDEVLFVKFIECARLALMTGIPEIDLPSYNPFVGHYGNSSYSSPYFSFFIAVDNLVLSGIPMWEVIQFDQLSASDDGVDIFNYTIHWHQVAFTIDYDFNYTFYGTTGAYKGTLSMEFDHITFAGLLDFTKPGDGRNATINDLTLKVNAEDILINSIEYDDLVSEINDADSAEYAEVAEALKNTLMNDWIQKTEKIDAIITHCQN